MEWIKLSEQPPPDATGEGITYIVWCDDWSYPRWAGWGANGFYTFMGIPHGRVTHWMPMPEPPK